VGGILDEYPEYEARFTGVGYPPAGPPPEGPCSQVSPSHGLITVPYKDTKVFVSVLGNKGYMMFSSVLSKDQRHYSHFPSCL
jgi:hypothetical protein